MLGVQILQLSAASVGFAAALFGCMVVKVMVHAPNSLGCGLGSPRVLFRHLAARFGVFIYRKGMCVSGQKLAHPQERHTPIQAGCSYQQIS